MNNPNLENRLWLVRLNRHNAPNSIVYIGETELVENIKDAKLFTDTNEMLAVIQDALTLALFKVHEVFIVDMAAMHDVEPINVS